MLPQLARLLAETVAGTAHVVYGSTEAEPIASIEAREMLAAMAARESGPRCEGICVGRPVAQVDLRLLRPSDRPFAGGDGWVPWEALAGEVGEVTMTGAHVLAGYLNNPEADRRRIRDGERVWHRTGDAGCRDEEGQALADGARERTHPARGTGVVGHPRRGAGARRGRRHSPPTSGSLIPHWASEPCSVSRRRRAGSALPSGRL